MALGVISGQSWRHRHDPNNPIEACDGPRFFRKEPPAQVCGHLNHQQSLSGAFPYGHNHMNVLNAGCPPVQPCAAISKTGQTGSEPDSTRVDDQKGISGSNPSDWAKLVLASCLTAFSGFAACSVFWASPSTESDCEPSLTLAADDSRQPHVTREQELHRLTQLWMRNTAHNPVLTEGHD